MIRVMLVEDHTMVREALRLVLEQDDQIQVVAEVGDGETALRMADKFSPDVVVMDIALPGPSGIETTQRMLGKHPGIKVLALSTYLNQGIVEQMLDAGASGYITKLAAGVKLARGIHSVAAGHTYLCAEVTALVTAGLRSRQSGSEKPDDTSLSARELQVVTFLAEGKSAPEIADKLHISPKTVDTHRRNVMRKLGMHNVVGLTKYAIRTGLILP